MKQAQEMQSKLQGANEELKSKRVTGSAGGGLVEVDANGLGEVLSVRIDPTLLEKGDQEMIEDLLPSAFNLASAKVKELHADAMKSLTDGVDLPGLSDALTAFMGGGDVPKEDDS